ncbi:hypothetical protein Pelo_10633 [Pelomyxa schiedti]|nr:hypothetical protein Pelo_10633 [Pelomyxa schiedti]
MGSTTSAPAPSQTTAATTGSTAATASTTTATSVCRSTHPELAPWLEKATSLMILRRALGPAYPILKAQLLGQFVSALMALPPPAVTTATTPEALSAALAVMQEQALAALAEITFITAEEVAEARDILRPPEKHPWDSLTDPHLVRTIDAPVGPSLVPFFDETGDFSSVALDISGSTSGAILVWSKDIATRMCGNRKALLDKCIAWDDRASIQNIDKLASRGGTNPSVVFDVLGPNVRSLLITTDGEIGTSEVASTRKRISTRESRLTNILAVLVGGRSGLPAALNLSVFAPFFEHCRKVGGVFALVHHCGSEGQKPKILMKTGTFSSTLPDPPKEYTNEIKWDQIPDVDPSVFSSLMAPDKPAGARVVVPGQISHRTLLRCPINVAAMAASLKQKTTWSDEELEQLDSFVYETLVDLAEAAEGEVVSLNALRDIAHIWKKLKTLQADKELTAASSNVEPLLREFETLTRKDKRTPEDTARLAALTEELLPLLQNRDLKRTEMLEKPTHFHSDLMQQLADFEKSSLNQQTLETTNDFSLAALTKMSNRARRAQTVLAPERQDKWKVDVGETCKCTDCAICCTGDRVAALLLVNLAEADPQAAAFNMSDVALNDPLCLGSRNLVAVPAGNLCMPCAYACYALGLHPLTRQPLSSVFVLADAAHAGNRNLMRNALSRAFFCGKMVGTEFQVLLSVVDALELTGRFPPEVIKFLQKTALVHSRGNLFTEGLGETLPLIEAMNALVTYPLVELQPESWLIPLRNKSVESIGLITRSVLEHVSYDSQSIQLCRGLLRRAFIKYLCSSLISIGKRTDGATELQKIHREFEADLYDVKPSGIPIFNSEHLPIPQSSFTLQALLGGPGGIYAMFNEFSRFCRRAGLEGELFTAAELAIIFSSLLNSVVERGVGACAVNVEALLKSLCSRGKPLAAIWFSRKGEEPTVEAALNCISQSAPYQGVHSTEGTAHHDDSCFACHLFSSTVSSCVNCGFSFVSDDDWRLLRSGKFTEPALKRIVDTLVNNRRIHWASVYHTKPTCSYPTRTSSIASWHKIARETALNPRFISLKRPTREMLEEMLHALRIVPEDRRGGIYNRYNSQRCLQILWDYMKRKNALTPAQVARLSIPMTIEERLVVEVQAYALPSETHHQFCSLDGLTQEELDAILLPTFHS